MCLRWIVRRVVSRPPVGWATEGRHPAMVMGRRSCEDHAVLGGHPSTFCFGHKALARNECLRVPCAGHLARPAHSATRTGTRTPAAVAKLPGPERARRRPRKGGLAPVGVRQARAYARALVCRRLSRRRCLAQKTSSKSAKSISGLSCRVARACACIGRAAAAGAAGQPGHCQAGCAVEQLHVRASWLPGPNHQLVVSPARDPLG